MQQNHKPITKYYGHNYKKLGLTKSNGSLLNGLNKRSLGALGSICPIVIKLNKCLVSHEILTSQLPIPEASRFCF